MLNQTIQNILRDAEQRVLSAVQGMDADGWEPVEDEDGNENIPSDSRQVLVFLYGCVADVHAPRPEDAGYGLRLGYYDHDKAYWRVHGRPEKYVTHWREEPLPPKPTA